jgi:hypothetical protein
MIRLEIDNTLIIMLFTKKTPVFVLKDFFSSSFDTVMYGKCFSTTSRTANKMTAAPKR